MTRGRLAPLRHPEPACPRGKQFKLTLSAKRLHLLRKTDKLGYHKENRRISENAKSGFGGMFAQTFSKEKQHSLMMGLARTHRQNGFVAVLEIRSSRFGLTAGEQAPSE